MTEILARIRVKETAGIRRFLYPLSAIIPPTFPVKAALITDDGSPVPTQISIVPGYPVALRLDFAVSLAPFAEHKLLLMAGDSGRTLEDSLDVQFIETSLRSVQQSFIIEMGDEPAGIHHVIYDSMSHLRGVAQVMQTGSSLQQRERLALQGKNLIAAWQEDQFDDSRTRIELTACKSWAKITHTLDAPKPGDEIVFTLPLAVKAPTLLCDFGAGCGIYGKLDDKTPEIVWKTNFDANGKVTWTLENSGRLDYAGEAASREEYLSQRWFHVIDDGKALAAAITNVPEACETLTVTLRNDGDVRVAFTMGEKTETATTCGVCWHFLNDVPAVAAATNPQSILLPPTVEVLPA